MLATLLIGGALADRYPRRTLMIISDLARCACMVVLFAVDVSGNLGSGASSRSPSSTGPATGSSTRPTADRPARRRRAPLASANALTGLSRQAAFVVGPAVAGVLYAVAGASSVFALNAVSFVVAAGSWPWRARAASSGTSRREP